LEKRDRLLEQGEIMIKFLNHPNFSLFCFMLNVWFAATNFLVGSYIFATFCVACAALCGWNYLSHRDRK